ncbi:MAG: hypothetical protein QXP27_08370 [Candidatus Methanomethyliaceae archaeon]
MTKWTTLTLSTFLVLTLMGILVVSGEAQQPPPLPHAFYGRVEINGQPAPAGTTVEARGQGVLVGIPGNPISVSQPGRYGGPGGFDPKLVVQGQIAEGTAIAFYVNGIRAQCAVPGGSWQDNFPFHVGGITELNLRITQEGTITPVPTITATITPSPTRGTVTATPSSTGTMVIPSPTSTGTPVESIPIATYTVSATSVASRTIPSSTVTPTSFASSSPVVASTSTTKPDRGGEATPIISGTVPVLVQQVTGVPLSPTAGTFVATLPALVSTSDLPASNRSSNESFSIGNIDGILLGWILVLVALVGLGVAGFVVIKARRKA